MAFTIVQSVTVQTGTVVPSVTHEEGVVVPGVTSVSGAVDLIPRVVDLQVQAIETGTPMGLLLAITYAS